jgi:hypothetical protein
LANVSAYQVSDRSLKPTIPTTSDSKVQFIYKYYSLLADGFYQDAYSCLSPLAKENLAFKAYKSAYDSTVKIPEKLLLVDVEIVDESKGDVKYRGRLVIGVKHRVEKSDSLTSILWSNSFADLWIKNNGEENYCVIPDAFSLMRKMNFRIIYKSRNF